MKMKSFFASDTNAALRLARREMGSEAMLVDTRPAPPESRHLGQFEVVVALSEEAEAAALEPVAQPDSQHRLSAGMADLQRKLERVASAIAKASMMSAGEAAPTGELAEVFASLVDNEVDAQLAHDMLARMRGPGAASSCAQIKRMLGNELAKRFTADATIGRGAEGPRTVALVGPSGSGKTSTLVKLAVLYGLSTRRPTHIVSMDSYRIAAADQLRSYAAILGVGFHSLDTPAALVQVLEELRNKDLILIDTPGYSARDIDAAEDLARLLASRDEIDTHLVLTASMKSADLSRVVDRFEVFRPRKLLFTKLDETETFGPILNEAVRTGKPISFLATGQQIPEDLEPATVERILELILRREEVLAAAAAA
jgi:flagellar biosynthesis protein FlhF